MDKGAQVYRFHNKKGETKYMRVYVDYNDLNGFIENAFIMYREEEIQKIKTIFSQYLPNLI